MSKITIAYHSNYLITTRREFFLSIKNNFFIFVSFGGFSPVNMMPKGDNGQSSSGISSLMWMNRSSFWLSVYSFQGYS